MATSPRISDRKSVRSAAGRCYGLTVLLQPQCWERWRFSSERLFTSSGLHVPSIAIVVVLAFIAWQAAYRGVQISAIVMLALEIVSVAIICLVVAIVLHAQGLSLDHAQLKLQGGFPGGIGPAIAFAIFSFVGFESATAFGAEAKHPLVTIPRAVVGSVIFAGLFFVIATYAEIVGFAHIHKSLAQESFPLGTPGCGLRHRRAWHPAHSRSALQRFLRMSGLHHHRRPHRLCDGAQRRAAARLWAHRAAPRHAEYRGDRGNGGDARGCRGRAAFGVAPIDVFNNCGALSSFGFLLIYGLTAVAAFVYCRKLGQARGADIAITVIALLLLIVPAVTLFYPVPAPPQRWFGYFFLIFIAAGWASFRLRKATG